MARNRAASTEIGLVHAPFSARRHFCSIRATCAVAGRAGCAVASVTVRRVCASMGAVSKAIVTKVAEATAKNRIVFIGRLRLEPQVGCDRSRPDFIF